MNSRYLTLEQLGIGVGVLLLLLIPVGLNLVGLKATAIGCSVLIAYGLVVVGSSFYRRSPTRTAELLEVVGVTCVIGGSLMQVAWAADALDRTGLLIVPVIVWPLVAVVYANLRRRHGVVDATGSHGAHSRKDADEREFR